MDVLNVMLGDVSTLSRVVWPQMKADLYNDYSNNNHDDNSNKWKKSGKNLQ